MAFRHFAVAAAALFIALAAAGQGVAQQSKAGGKGTFRGFLSATPADARTRAGLTGSGTISAVLEGSKLEITGSFEGLAAGASAAKLHSGVMAGVRGPEVGDLTVSKATSGTISGSLMLTPQQIAYLQKGGLYVMIDTPKTTEGALWGWLVPQEAR